MLIKYINLISRDQSVALNRLMKNCKNEAVNSKAIPGDAGYWKRNSPSILSNILTEEHNERIPMKHSAVPCSSSTLAGPNWDQAHHNKYFQ